MIKTVLVHLPALLRMAGPCLGVLAVGLAAFAADARAGGRYHVSECSPGHAATPDATVRGAPPAFAASTSCETGSWLQVESVANAAAGVSKQWSYEAPAGTRIERVTADYSLVGDASPDGNRSYLFVRRYEESAQEDLSVVGLGSTAGTYDSDLQPLGPLSGIGVGLRCAKATEVCTHAPDQFARIADVDFTMEDISPPSVPVVMGDAADGAWVSGSTPIVVAGVDVGGGVNRTTVEVNGTQVINDVACDPGLDGDGRVGSMAPCDKIVLRTIDVDTESPAFREGQGNVLRVCTHEFGTAAALTCGAKSVKVDNIAPAAPDSLEVAGEADWHRDNDFDLSWTNPPQSDAPIVAAVVTITGSGGFSATETFEGEGINSAENLEVPAVGSYTADVHLVDAAGNGRASNESSVPLKFDDTVPVKSTPDRANGWISRSEIANGYDQNWERPTDEDTPPSGIDGYRATIDMNAGSDPCVGSSDARACGGAITESGINTTSRTLWADDLAEGSNFVHVVPVSGSGMRATAVGHTALNVDLTDPRTDLHGPVDGWVNHVVEVEAVASDELSGMIDTDEYPDDSPPRTVLAIDGDVVADLDADVSASIKTEGVHRVEYWARDLAGNENDGKGGNAARGSATVRIDSTPPAVAFANAQDPADPDRLVAVVNDSLSGVKSGTIEYRRGGAESWTTLKTEITDHRLISRVDSNDLSPGVRYEFRARAVDVAGNERVSDRRADGSRMSVVGPFRTAASIRELTINGRKRARIGFRKSARVAGQLVDGSGAPIAGARVDLAETYMPGSIERARTLAATTDATGSFSMKLAPGPSRTLTASFAGDSRRLGASSGAASLRVKGKVSLKATRRVRAGSKATFRGRVKAPGASFSRQGKSVEIQVRVGRRWKTVGRSLRTDRRGGYSLRYRFVASYSRPIKYRFRTVVLRERGWPYLPSASRVRKVLVMP